MNLKGGTGKTTTAINVAAILAHDYGQRVLLVDCDCQANLTEFVSPQPGSDSAVLGGMADLLRGMACVPVPTKMKGVKLIAADESLMALDVSSAGNGKADPMALADFLDGVREDFDWVLIDCPPAFSAAAMAALIAADEVLIPMKLDAFGIRGMKNLLEQIRNMRKINAGLSVTGVLPTMRYPSEQTEKAEAELKQALRIYGIPLLHPIRRSGHPVDKMTFSQQPLIKSSPTSGACRDYRMFVGELIGEEAEQDGV